MFVRALETPPANPKPWLFAVALNLAPVVAPPPDQALEAGERAAAVRAALAKLTEQDRAALLLQAEGLDYGEIAAALGLAKGAIGTTLSRARKRLVEAFREQGRVNHVAR